ncbi:MAG: hypothetical protein KF724_04095 [Phycisphaeraceae bacterium]|nr:hypothetical protein [Phycisphaeraceae bacterium]
MDSVASGSTEVAECATESLKAAVTVDAEKVRSHLDEMVRSTVEQTLNAMLEVEADQACGAGRYERSRRIVWTLERELRADAGDEGALGEAWAFRGFESCRSSR